MQVFEHEIPSGSRLYFGKNAKIKREIEQRASRILEENEFSEIITPFFSYHQGTSVAHNKLIRLSDNGNTELCLRSDSTIDVARIVMRRLKAQNIKKWFYIQPVFFYPSTEVYQIGAEMLGSTELWQCAKISAKLLDSFDIKACLQISNMEIPHLLCRILGFDMSVFEQGRIEVLFERGIPWLDALAKSSKESDIKELLGIVPDELKEPLNAMLELGQKVGYENASYAPIYYSKMRYYDGLFFRFLKDNYILASGGTYEIDELLSAGFAVLSDNLIEILA